MANKKHLNVLMQGVVTWNDWRKEHPKVRADLTGAILSGADLTGADLHSANLTKANLTGADLAGANLNEAELEGTILERARLHARLGRANLTGADLHEANLHGTSLFWGGVGWANLTGADLSGADLTGADLSGATLIRANLHGTIIDHRTRLPPKSQLIWQIVNDKLADKSKLSGENLSGENLSGADLTGAILSGADLTGADLSGATLIRATLVMTDLTHADLSNCHIFGISAWKLRLESTIQKDLIITDSDEAVVTVDNLEVAQFIYLLLHNEKIREVIDTITSKAVLILGRFTTERKAVLNAIREELRKRNYTPIVFDFEKPTSRDLTETVMTLAGMARFVIADLSDPNSIPHELMSFAEKLLSVPVQAIFCSTPKHETPYPMYEHLLRYPHVLPIYEYENQKKLIATLSEKVIQPAEEKAKELRPGS